MIAIIKCLAKESHNQTYKKRLERLGLTDLKTRRETVDLIQIYKIFFSSPMNTRTLFLLNRMATQNNFTKVFATQNSFCTRY